MLRGHIHLALDTSIFIYFVEEHPRYHALCEPIFQSIESGKIRATTSTLSLLEIQVQPYRQQREDLVLKFFALLTTYPHLNWYGLSLDVADRAASLRAEYGLKTPDAIQMATAVCSGASGFLCNDPVFKRVKEMKSLLLEDCFPKTGET